MESVHIDQRLRPARHAFVINAGDLGAALQAVSINTALWGGIYNPIVPNSPTDHREGLLKEFDPDLLVNLTGGTLSADLGRRYEGRIVEAAELVRFDDRTQRRSLAVGFNILPVLREVHDKEIRFSTKATRAVLLLPASAPAWAEFSGFAHGSFKWLPALDSDFRDGFEKALRATRIDVPELTLPPEFENALLPIEFTRYGLRSFRDSANFSSHIIFVGDHRNTEDLIAFWNIRATGRTVAFVPAEKFDTFEPIIRAVATQGRYRINENVENHADLQRGPSLSETRFQEICTWIEGLKVAPLVRRNWQPRYGHEMEHYAGDIHVAEIEASHAEEISILENARMTPVKLIRPPFLQDYSAPRSDLSWAIEIATTGGYDNDLMLKFPNDASVEELVRRNQLSSARNIRIGRHGIVLQQEWVRENYHPQPVPTADVFDAIFNGAGITVGPSQPGQYADQMIKKMGHLHSDCRVFKIRGVRAVLDRLGNGAILTKGNIYQEVTQQSSDEHGQNWRPDLYNDLVLRSGQKRPLEFGTIFDVLLEKRILRPGLKFRCAACFKEDWYHVSEFSEEYTCRFCFNSQRVNFGATLDWQYKADGLFQIPDSAQGSVAVILSIWRLNHLTHTSAGRYITSRNLVVRDTGRQCEIDYACLGLHLFDSSYEFVIGQATRFGDFKDEDMRNMAEVADRFATKPYLAFSTLRDRYSDADKARFRELHDRGYRVITLTREELDPYDLHNRFRNAPYPHVINLDEFAKNTYQLNVLGIS